MSESDSRDRGADPSRESRPPTKVARLAALFAFGAVVLSIFDGFHTHSGTTRYPSPVAWEAAWWTPLAFGASTGVGGPIFVLVYRALGGKRPPPPWSHLAVAFVLYGALYYMSGYLHASNETKLAILAVATLVLYLWLDRTVAGALAVLLTAVIGPLAEVIQVHAGLFEHLQPDFLGIPMWLPALYTASAVVIGHGSRRWLGQF
jgi:hypothetical protein